MLCGIKKGVYKADIHEEWMISCRNLWYIPQDFPSEGSHWGLVYSGKTDFIKKNDSEGGDDQTAWVKNHHPTRGNEDTGLASAKCSFWGTMQVRLDRRQRGRGAESCWNSVMWYMVGTNQGLTGGFWAKEGRDPRPVRRKVRQASGHKVNEKGKEAQRTVRKAAQ